MPRAHDSIRAMRLSGVMLISSGIEECTAFYAELLQAPARLGSGWAQFDLPHGQLLAIHTPWSPALSTTSGSTVTLLDVDDLDAEVRRLASAGIAASDPHDIPGGRLVTINDPDGRLVQLIEHAAS